MKKHTNGLTTARLLILAITTISLTGCGLLGAPALIDEGVVAQRTLQLRQDCADALADSDIQASRIECLEALEALAAGFGE